VQHPAAVVGLVNKDSRKCASRNFTKNVQILMGNKGQRHVRAFRIPCGSGDQDPHVRCERTRLGSELIEVDALRDFAKMALGEQPPPQLFPPECNCDGGSGDQQREESQRQGTAVAEPKQCSRSFDQRHPARLGQPEPMLTPVAANAFKAVP